ncbi:MAG: endopeptidase La, partial [OM182 bacterium]
GLKEKLLAAHRGGIRHVVIPKENEKDLKEIPENVKDNLTIHAVSWMDEVLEIALERMPTPVLEDGLSGAGVVTEKVGEEKGSQPSTGLNPH